jgi:peptidoglycan/LPS O-acetylase OafA/YrhL
VQSGRPHRADIDGLRAVALLAVLTFDVSIRWLPGGFAGIDIFFMLSGYLITSTVGEDLDGGTFSLRGFYERRVRRLLPALLVVVVASFVLGWFVLFAQEYRALGRDMAGAAALDDSRSPTRILGHLRPIAALLPFYIVWPVVLRWLHKHPAIVDALIAALLALFLIADLSGGWALMAGCGLVSLQRRGWLWQGPGADLATGLGGLLLVCGLVLGLHGRWLVLPVLGALLLLSAGPGSWLSRKILGNPVAVGIGRASYPLYLWHWPLLSFLEIANSTIPSGPERVAAVAFAVLLAGVTYRFVERPARDGVKNGMKTAALLGLAAVVAVTGFGCYRMNGFPGTGIRGSDRQAFLDFFAGELVDPGCTTGCTERDPTHRHAVLLWGDDHARELYSGLRRTLPADWQILQVARPGCAPDVTIAGPSTSDPCAQSNWTALQTIAAGRPDVVVVAQDRGQLISRSHAIADRLSRLGVTRTLLLGPTPRWRTELPTIVARRLWHDTPRRTLVGVDPSLAGIDRILAAYLAPSERMAFVDVMDVFCNSAGCLTYVGDDRRTGLTSTDGNHLRPAASDYLARQRLARMITGSVEE